jgi:hypothetical protein
MNPFEYFILCAFRFYGVVLLSSNQDRWIWNKEWRSEKAFVICLDNGEGRVFGWFDRFGA